MSLHKVLAAIQIPKLAKMTESRHGFGVLICPVCESVFPDGTADRCPHDQSPLYVIGDDVASRKALGTGDIVAGKYELLEEIPRRAVRAEPFRAKQIHLEREVELRLLPENTITAAFGPCTISSRG